MEPEDLQETVSLVNAAQEGDGDALNELFTRYLPRVRRVVELRLSPRRGSLEDIDDLVQDSLIDALRSLDRFEHRSTGTFCNWLARCVENNIRDHVRKGGAEKRDRGRERSLADCGPTTLGDSILAGSDPTPSQIAQGRELESCIEAAMLELSERYREVILLRSVCGMSAAEVATEMGIAREATSQKVYERARAKLMEALDL